MQTAKVRTSAHPVEVCFAYEPRPPAGAAAPEALGVPAPPGPLARPCPRGTGTAATLLSHLRARDGVAIALPLFDSPNGLTHNWATRAAQTFGAVQNPLPRWVANGGHAVLCVGFVPDSEELVGGHFIMRNSWGVRCGFGLPDSAYSAPCDMKIKPDTRDRTARGRFGQIDRQKPLRVAPSVFAVARTLGATTAESLWTSRPAIPRWSPSYSIQPRTMSDARTNTFAHRSPQRFPGTSIAD